MKKSLFAFLLIFALLFAAFSAAPASAADKATVVYLKDDGKGDGSSPENAVSDLFDAYDALDLSKDCTVVVCGAYGAWNGPLLRGSVFVVQKSVYL